ncbi:MAG TPA: Ig-like domain-containing protein, partial [Verrucomicrobiota bacterium]|nr:Ig-like domain-containing protein [Verrucomicrobiota bacterium]
VARLEEGAALGLVVVNDCRTLRAFRPGRADPLWTAFADGRLAASPVAVDLSGDGRDEIVATAAASGPGRPGGVHVFDGRGRRHGNWPVLLEQSFTMPAAVGDVDGDGVPEVAVIAEDTRRVHLLDRAGFPLEGWPTPMIVDGSPRSPPILADVTGDGRPEVVVAMAGQWNVVQLTDDLPRMAGVRAFGLDGREVNLQPHPRLTALVFEGTGGPLFKAPAAAAADLAGSGFLSLVAASVEDTAYSPDRSLRARKGRATVYAWDTWARAAAAAAPWPARPGRLDLPPPLNQPPIITALPPQTVAPGGAFRPLQLDRYVDDPDDARETLVWSVEAPPDLVVRLDAVRVLTVEPASVAWTGRAEVRLTVRDRAGNEAATVAVFAVVEGFVPPRAVPDFAETDEDLAVDLAVTDNDSSPDGGPVRLQAVSRPGQGTTRLLPDGRVRYTPAKDWFGEDSFEYVITDARGGSAAAEVRVTVHPVPDPPVAVPDQLVLDEDTEAELDVLENDYDPDGDAITLVSVRASENASVRRLGGGLVRYTPKPDF